MITVDIGYCLMSMCGLTHDFFDLCHVSTSESGQFVIVNNKSICLNKMSLMKKAVEKDAKVLYLQLEWK